jgi:hypothetical protein
LGQQDFLHNCNVGDGRKILQHHRLIRQAGIGAGWKSPRLAHEGEKLRSGRGEMHFELDTGFKLF